MEIDCLCITTSRRKKFKNWVLWNYLKQLYYNKNLIVVSDDDDWPSWVEFVYADIKENIPTKRNMALGTALGDAITWFDDDDWQSPRKLQIIAESVDMKTNVGCSKSFFYDIMSGKVSYVDLGVLPIFNSIGIARYGLPSFNESIEKGSDTSWLKKLEYRGNYITDTMMSFWLVHDDNTTNPAKKINAQNSLVYYLDGETWQQLTKLRANLLLG